MMQRQNRLHWISGLLLASTCFSQGALSQEAEIRLEEIVVTATATERNLKDAPASVSVVSGEDLRQRPVQDLADAISDTPGIEVTGVGLGHKGISIRGMQPDHTLVLIDGMRISNSASAIAHSDFELGWVPAEAIERVEIVRGPMSSLYGSEALGGVVNIITRRATDEWRSSASTSAAFTEHGLGGQQYKLSGYTGGPLVRDVLGLSLWGEVRQKEALTSPDNDRVTSRGEESTFNGNATLTWTPDERQRVDLDLQGGIEDRWSALQGTGRFPTYYRSEDDITKQRISLAHQGSWGWGDSRVRVYRSILDRENERSDGAAPLGPHKFIDTVGDGQISFSPLSNHKLTLGGEVREEQLEDPTVNLSGEASQTHFAAFAQDEIVFDKDWELVLGTRADHHEQFGLEISPRAYLLYHFSEALTLKTGVGKGFKAPTLKQLSPEYAAIAGGGRFTITGNPDLEPETNVSLEAGAEYQQGIWSARVVAFQNNVDNLIQTVCIVRCSGAPGATWSYENIDQARINGVELGVGVELASNLRFDANYTYLDPIDETTGQRLLNRSNHLANLNVTWSPLTDLTTRFRAQYIGEQDTSTGTGRADGYVLLSAYSTYALSPEAALQFGVENITDERLADDAVEYSIADEGRRWFVGLRTQF